MPARYVITADVIVRGVGRAILVLPSAVFEVYRAHVTQELCRRKFRFTAAVVSLHIRRPDHDLERLQQKQILICRCEMLRRICVVLP